MIRTGDRINHKPTGRVLIVAYADPETGRFAAVGLVGEGYIRDCELSRACSDEAHLDAVAELAVSGDPAAERAARIAAKTIGRAA